MIKQAQLEWSDGTPVSTEFSDVYFNKANGAEETRYVFIEGNNLDTRWPIDTPHNDHFTIAETGFGTGLNFLCAWDLWLKKSKPHQHLHFLSVEKFPLSKESLIQALSSWPQYEALSQQLINNYPPMVDGWHTLHLPNPYHDTQSDDHEPSSQSGNVILHLYLGDVHDWLPQVDAQVDAWFLDGFAPSRNPDMWNDQLFLQMARLTPANGTVATFTAASKIQRGLKAAGFKVSKRKGYGHKREMVMASQQHTNGPKIPAWLLQQPWLESRHENTFQNKTATIIGAGIAGCSSAYALAKRGWHVTLIEQDTIASGASGNSQGVLYAKLSAEMNLHSQFYLAGYLLSLQYLKKQLPDKKNWNNCGVLQLATNEKEEKRQANFSRKYQMDDIVIPVDTKEASRIAGSPIPYTGLFFKDGAWVYPTEWCHTLIQHKNITVIESTQAIRIDKKYNSEKSDSHWEIQCNNDSNYVSDVVIICNANEAKNLTQLSFLPTKPVSGQVTQLPSQSIKLDTVLCGDHYVTPTHNENLNFGASYRIKSDNIDVLTSENESNINNLISCFPSIGDQIYPDSTAIGRASVRCTTPDYTPIAGAVCNQTFFDNNFSELKKNRKWKFQKPAEFYKGLYVNLGHGSRGLSSAPLCSDMIVAQITGEPLPLPKSQANIINPNRFLVNALIKK